MSPYEKSQYEYNLAEARVKAKVNWHKKFAFFPKRIYLGGTETKLIWLKHYFRRCVLVDKHWDKFDSDIDEITYFYATKFRVAEEKLSLEDATFEVLKNDPGDSIAPYEWNQTCCSDRNAIERTYITDTVTR